MLHRNDKPADSRSPSERYAEARSKGVVTQVLWTMRLVVIGCFILIILAMVANFQRQHDFLVQHTEGLEAIITPTALDLFTIMCAAVIATPALERGSKWWAFGGLLFGVAGSGSLSWLAPGDNIGKAVAAGIVALIAVAEAVANHLHVDGKELKAVETERALPVSPEAKPGKEPTVLTDDEKAQRERERRRDGYANKTPGDKTKWTVDFNRRIADQRAKQARLAAKTAAAVTRRPQTADIEASYSLPSAPVSGAPATTAVAG
jgi:hypothetical protein